MGQREAMRRALEDAQAGKPAAVQAKEFILEEMREELEKPAQNRTLKSIVDAGLRNARRHGIAIASDMRLGPSRKEVSHAKEKKREKGAVAYRNPKSKRAA